MGAVSTIENRRWRNAPSIRGYLEALEAGGRPPREPEELSDEVRETERVMLGLRLDEPVTVASAGLDRRELERLERLGLVSCAGASAEGDVAASTEGSLTAVSLTAKGRFLGDGVTAHLLA